MKTTAISNHAFQLTRLGLVNCYLVREDDGFTLIKSGSSGSALCIIAAVAEHAAQMISARTKAALSAESGPQDGK